jgi:putative DNA primase/helicase
MPVYTTRDYEAFWLAELPEARHNSHANEIRASCPIHGGSRDSLWVNLETGYAHCHSCGKKWSMIEWSQARYGDSERAAIERIAAATGAVPASTWSFPFSPPAGIPGFSVEYLAKLLRRFEAKLEAQATHLYLYPQHIKVRFAGPNGKTFIQFALTPKGGWSSPRKLGITSPLYRAGELAGAGEVIFANGEKAVERVRSAWGAVATCLPDGEGRWREDFALSFHPGQVVWVAADNDEVGRHHARVIAGALARAKVEARPVYLPGLPEKGDLWDYIEAGGTKEQFLEIAAVSPPGDPTVFPRENRGARHKQEATLPHATVLNGDGPSLLDFSLNEHGNADRLLALHGEDIRYSPSLKSWLRWTGQVWQPAVDAGPVELLAMNTLQRFHAQAKSAGLEVALKYAFSSHRYGMIRNMLHIVRPRVMIEPAQLDTHPWLLNFSNGTVDLRTGALTPHDRMQFLTKIVHHPYRPEAPAPRWMQFLRETFADPDKDPAHEDRMLRYMQIAIGYSFTGITTAKIVFMPFGPTNSGKTTLIGLLHEITSEYAKLLFADTITSSISQSTNNTLADLAGLRGARFAHTSELAEGARLSEEVLKRICQGRGGAIQAALKFGNPFSFLESHHLWIDTNSRPRIVNTDDDAVFNRLHLIPFPNRVANDRLDRDLFDALLAEAAGILAWIVEGARIFAVEGLRTVEEIAQSTADWRAENDILGAFFEEKIIQGEWASALISQVYSAYKDWAIQRGEHPMTSTRFGRSMTHRGVERGRNEKGDRIYKGITLKMYFAGSSYGAS